MPTTTSLSQPVFAEPVYRDGSFSSDPAHFRIPHPSDAALYTELGNALKKNAVAFARSRGAPDDLYPLASALGAPGANAVAALAQAGRIVFHALGDTGASNEGKYRNELSVADHLVADCRAAKAADRPAFLFNLGDVVYDFGESRYYYDQFYEPYRHYPGPIFAIPGNHDSFVVPGTPAAAAPLKIFARNFCAPKPVITPEAGSLHRTAMTQPGVYFTLDAPFVRIIGLFSNALEDPGVISSEGGKWPKVPDHQLAFLAAQLQRIKKEKYAGAVLLAMHHPPFTYHAPPRNGAGAGGNHAGSTDMLREIDRICVEAGVYPHAVLSGHAHNYQRYTRAVTFGAANFQVPFVVSGSGGHNVTPVGAGAPPTIGQDVNHLDPKPAVTTTGLTLENFDDHHYGFLRVTVDAKTVRIVFQPVGATGATTSPPDAVTVDLATHRLVAS